jgi:general secretion pathway protein A
MQMYIDYFALKELPFSIAPNPQYLYMSGQHQEALAHLLFGIQSEVGGFILLTGEVGTGKTTLCRCLLEQIPMDVETAFVLNPKVSAIELLQTISDEFGFAGGGSQSLKSLTDALNLYLLKEHRAGKRAVLIIDEAQNLSREVLEQLRLLTNLETNERKLLQIILLGQPELGETLNKRSLRQFSQRITARYHLEALKSNETRDYIAHRLKVAGGDSNLFDTKASHRIHQLTGGVPRLINLICDRSMLGTYAEDKKIVSLATVNKAAVEVMGTKRSSFNWGLLTLTASVTVALFILLWIKSPLDEAPDAQDNVFADAEQQNVSSNQPASTSIAPPNEDDLNLTIQGHNDIRAAWYDLFALWGTAFADQKTAPCELAKDISLECMERQVSWQELQRIDRPMIVFLEEQYFTISEINHKHVTLLAGNKQFELTRIEFLERFDGRISMSWRIPPNYDSPLKLYDRGPEVDWLAAKLAMIEGKQEPIETGTTFTSLLKSRVEKFQNAVGLEPDGVAGPLTLININSFGRENVPRLTADDED